MDSKKNQHTAAVSGVGLRINRPAGLNPKKHAMRLSIEIVGLSIPGRTVTVGSVSDTTMSKDAETRALTLDVSDRPTLMRIAEDFIVSSFEPSDEHDLWARGNKTKVRMPSHQRVQGELDTALSDIVELKRKLKLTNDQVANDQSANRRLKVEIQERTDLLKRCDNQRIEGKDIIELLSEMMPGSGLRYPKGLRRRIEHHVK